MRIAIGMLVAMVLASACKDEAPATEGSAPKANAPKADAPKADAPAKAEPPLTGHAVVKVGAHLFFASTGDAGVDLPPLGKAPGLAVSVVGEQGGRVAIDTLVAEPAEHHCAAMLDGLAHMRVRLYVAAADLLPVLTEDHEHAFDDGTKVRLARGVPVPAGSPELVVRGTPIRVPVPPERTGRSYAPGQPFSTEGGEGKIYPLPPEGGQPDAVGHALTYGGESLDEAGLHREAGNVVRFGSTPKGDGALVTVRNPCLEVTALASKARMSAPPSFDGLIDELEAGHHKALEGDEWSELGLVGAKPPVAAAGTALTWGDGQPAGQVTASHRFTTLPRAQDGRTCFDVPLVAGQTATVTLCVAPGDLGTGDLGIAPSGGAGFGGRAKGVSQIKPSQPTITGTLDPKLIRRIVRAHINEVRTCYEEGLARDPALAGKISIQATIDAKGEVKAAAVVPDGTTLTDAGVGECIAKTWKTWAFPKPSDGGEVIVTYPFVLEPG